MTDFPHRNIQTHTPTEAGARGRRGKRGFSEHSQSAMGREGTERQNEKEVSLAGRRIRQDSGRLRALRVGVVCLNEKSKRKDEK